jgi:hypothetical protein
MPRARAAPRPRPAKPSTAKGARNLKPSQYAYPKPGGKGRGKYPISTAKKFRAALAYAGRKTTAGSRATIIRRGLRAPNPQVRAAARRARAAGVAKPTASSRRAR